MNQVLALYDLNKDMLEKAMTKYPERIYVANTTRWHEDPDEVMTGVFNFLGLDWRTDYLNMDAINAKRASGSVKTAPFSKKKNEGVSVVFVTEESGGT